MKDAVAQEFDALLVRVLEETTTDEDRMLLNLILEEHPELIAGYRAQMRMHVLMRQMAAAAPEAPAPPQPLASRMEVWWRWVAAVAAVLTVAGMVWLWRAAPGGEEGAAARPLRQAALAGRRDSPAGVRRTSLPPVFVEVLAASGAAGRIETTDGVRDCMFDAGDWCEIRRVRLDSGRLTFALGSEVVVTAFGPCEMSLENEKSLGLDRGMVFARVGEKGRGFEVRTRHQRIIDRGTAFGVRVHPRGAADVCVFEGHVSVADTYGKEAYALEAGAGVFTTSAGVATVYAPGAVRASAVKLPRLASATGQEAAQRRMMDGVMLLGLEGGGDDAAAGPGDADRFDLSVEAVADAYVQQSVPDGNAGSQPVQWLKGYGNYVRELFLTFDLPETVKGCQIDEARVRLFRHTEGDARGDDLPLVFEALGDTTWDEQTVTWRNPPLGLSLPSSPGKGGSDGGVIAQDVHVPFGNGACVDVDVSRQVRAARAVGKSAFGLHVYAASRANRSLYLYSREAQAEYRPTLRLRLTDTPAAVSAVWQSDDAVELSWAKHEKADGYIVQRGATVEGPFETIGVTDETKNTDGHVVFGERNVYYRVAAVLEDGSRTPYSRAVCPHARERIRYPSADAFVRDGFQCQECYGASEDLEIRRNVGPGAGGQSREVLLRFDPAGLAFAESVRLRLYYRKLLNNDITFVVRELGETQPPWNEGSVSWEWLKSKAGMTLPTLDEKPVGELARFETTVMNVGSHIDADVTAAAQARAAAGEPLSLHLYSVTPGVQGNHMVTLASKETPAVGHRPALVCTGEAFPQELRAVALDGSVQVTWRPMGRAASNLLERARHPDGPWQNAWVISGDAGYLDDGVRNGLRYFYRVAACAGNGQTSAFSETVAATPLPVSNLVVEADTYVAGGDRRNTCFAGDGSLLIKRGTQPEDCYEALLRFDCRPGRTIQKATLRLTVVRASADTTNTVVAFEALSDFAGWEERHLTWQACANAGVSLVNLAAFRPRSGVFARRQMARFSAGDRIEVDVTEPVKRAQSAGQKLVVHLYPETGGDGQMVSVASKENALFEAPSITYSYQTPPTGTLMCIQ